jgi:hypothetical protein
MRSRLVAISAELWHRRGSGVSPGEVAAIALAIERRRLKNVMLQREAQRYALLCERIAELAQELLDDHLARALYAENTDETRLWVMLSHDLVARIQRSGIGGSGDQIWPGIYRLRSTFIPPSDTSAVASCLDLLIRDHVTSWNDHDVVLPALRARANVVREAAARGEGLVDQLQLVW